MLTSWRRCSSNAGQDKALWVPTALCVLSRVGVGPALELWLRQAAVVLREDVRREDVSLRRRLVQLADEAPKPARASYRST